MHTNKAICLRKMEGKHGKLYFDAAYFEVAAGGKLDFFLDFILESVRHNADVNIVVII